MKSFDEDILDLLTAEDVGRLIKGILFPQPPTTLHPSPLNTPLEKRGEPEQNDPSSLKKEENMDMGYLSQYSSFLSKFAPLHTTILKIESQHQTLESSLPTLLTNLNQSLKCNKSFLESLVHLTQSETELLQKEKFLSELVNSSSIDRDQQRSLFNMNATKDDGVLREIDYINSTIFLVKQLKDIEIAMKENYP